MSDSPVRAMLDAADAITAKLVENEHLRQALEEIRRIHAPVQIGVLPGDCFQVCAGCCYADDFDRDTAHRMSACVDWHHHGDEYPICPTAAILDRAGIP